MRIVQILQGVENQSAGPTYSVGTLSHYLSSNAHDVTVIALGYSPSFWPHASQLMVFNGPSVNYGLAPPKAIAFARHQLFASPGILHGHGVWRIANLYPLLRPKNSETVVVWSPRGMFSEWSWNYRRWLKQPFWHLLQKPALSKVHCFHATADSEYDDIRRLGFRQPIAIIPNGIDVPTLDLPVKKRKSIVFLSRIHPKKGVHTLLSAWDKLGTVAQGWDLLIAGKVDTGYAERLVQLVKERNIPRVTFLGEILGASKTALLSQSSLFVLPSYSENFGIAIAEALVHATPVITTTETPWAQITEKGCGWCIRPDVSSLENALRLALTSSEQELHAMGQRGREWVSGAFAWPRIADMMQEFYIWTAHGGRRPDFVGL